MKIYIQLFVLQTSSNVLKHISHKVRRSYLAISGCFDALNFDVLNNHMDIGPKNVPLF